MRCLLFVAIALLGGCDASLAQVSTMGTTAMGLSSTPGTILTSPLNGPSPFSAATVPGTPDTTLAPVPLTSDPHNAGNGRDVFCADRANRAWNTCRASCFHVGDRHGRTDAVGLLGTDGLSTSAWLFRTDNRKCDCAVDIFSAAGNIIRECFSRLDCPVAAAAGSPPSAFAFLDRRALADVIDSTGHNFRINARHDHNVVNNGAGGRNDFCLAVGDSLSDSQYDDREHCADKPARQFLSHDLQLDARRPAEQRRGFAAFNAANSRWPSARHDTTGCR